MAPPEGEEAVPLEALQGEWVASRGEAIRVSGADLEVNGRPMPGGLKVTADGQWVLGFGIYKAAPEGTAGPDGQVIWRAGYQEIIWRRASEDEVRARAAQVEARMLETAAICGGQAFEALSEQEAVRRLNSLIDQWREGPAILVLSCDVCPDWTNRAETGLSVEHVHYIATLIGNQGFKSRRRGLGTHDGAHDVPILVRETSGSELGGGALAKWREATSATRGFPPYLLEGKDEFFCSLGNGHFSQALNLFRTTSQNLWTERPYIVGEDEALQEALEHGVESVVLSRDMPVAERRFVSEMLNRSHGRRWEVGSDGRVSLEEEGPVEAASSQFVALSKVLDAEELSCLVRQKLGVDVDGAPMEAAPAVTAVAPVATAGGERQDKVTERVRAKPSSRL